MISANASNAQNNSEYIFKGNQLYRKQQYDKALEEYQQALIKNENDPVANFNAGNASFRKNNYDDAQKYYGNAINGNRSKEDQQHAFYNEGLSFVKQQKLEEGINAWKEALKLKPDDKEARENLEKALREKKKREQEQQSKKPRQQNKPQNQPQSKLSQQKVEQLLKALQQHEKAVNDKLNQSKIASLSRPEKDW